MRNRHSFTFFILLLCILNVLTGNGLFGQATRVMSWNIRYNNPGDGVNAWPNRAEKVYALVGRVNPDILCMQEVLHDQVLDLASALKDYNWFGVGRDNGDDQGEYVPVFYRKNRFKLLRGNHFWLSSHPEQPGILGWDAVCTRMVTWVLLLDKTAKDTLLVFNTHFDHVGVEARKESAKLVLEAIRNIAGDQSAILTGDLNSTPDSEAYKTLSYGSLKDTRLASITPPSGPEYTFTGFDRTRPPGKRIDYIFSTGIPVILNYTVNDDHDDVYYPSDHLPVIVSLEL